MRLGQIINEDFSWDSDWDKDMYISFKGLANKNNGVWKSKKQRDFMLSRLDKQHHVHSPQEAKDHFGLEMSGNEKLLIVSGMTRWADYGSRSLVPVRHAFIVDNIGVRQHVKLGNKGNMRDGSGVEPKKNKVEFDRPENVDTSHLAKSEEEKKKEFKTALGMSEGEYVGEPGKRMDFGTLTLAAKKQLEDSRFGYNMAAERFWNLYKDEQGRNIVHVGKQGPERGEKIRIVATVKDHYVSDRGDKSTRIIRPRFYDVETNEEMIHEDNDAISKGDRVWFRPQGVYPFTYGHAHTGLGDRRVSKQFPEDNRVEGTVVGKEFDGHVDVKLDKPVRGTISGKRRMIDVIPVRTKLLKKI